ncbi:MAG TPA: Rid family hydrolase [Pseudonocardia sp.]|jgi:enamine deaminase RidA (YjgF/YER057c/UK114 family)|nr:Rid family hydrolase [Pseudonocardia sp.]
MTQFRTERKHAFTGVPYEETYGYCRGVRIGDRVLVSGSSALGTDGKIDPALDGDLYGQAKVAIGKIDSALTELGLSLDHVVRTTFYVVDQAQQLDAARAHGEFFGKAKPAFTMVGIPFLYGDGLIEIEVEAVE